MQSVNNQRWLLQRRSVRYEIHTTILRGQIQDTDGGSDTNKLGLIGTWVEWVSGGGKARILVLLRI